MRGNLDQNCMSGWNSCNNGGNGYRTGYIEKTSDIKRVLNIFSDSLTHNNII